MNVKVTPLPNGFSVIFIVLSNSQVENKEICPLHSHKYKYGYYYFKKLFPVKQPFDFHFKM